MVRLKIALGLLMALLPSVALAGRLEKDAIEVGPGVEPPRIDGTSSTPLRDVPSAVEGSVTVRLLIDATGAVRKIKILESSDSRLTNRARQLLSGAKFAPAKRDGAPVPVWWTRTLNFVSAAGEIASILACDLSTIESNAPIDPRGEAGLTLLVLLRDAVPKPTTAILHRGAGFARLGCVIDVCGRVKDCNVLASSGSEYAEPAIAAARERLYRPARRGGKPVAIYVTLTTSFQF